LICIAVIVIPFHSVDGLKKNGCATRLTGQVPLVEQELLTIPEHMSSPLTPFLVAFVLLDL
jgi:hypothetical protein